MPAQWTIERLRDDVRDLISESFLRNRQGDELQTDEDLLKALSSLQLLRMVLELESRYAVKIDNSELTPENLGTVERVADFVTTKLGDSERPE